MHLKSLTPMLYTQDIPGTLGFYTSVMGFTCTAIEESWISLLREGVHLKFSTPHAHLSFERAIFTGSLYLNVEGVAAWWERLRSHEAVRVAYSLEFLGNGRQEFAIYDNNGYLLQLGEESSAA